MKNKTVRCKQCSAPVPFEPGRKTVRVRRKFCSQKCTGLARRKIRPITNCHNCGNILSFEKHTLRYGRNGQNRYCDTGCHVESQRKNALTYLGAFTALERGARRDKRQMTISYEEFLTLIGTGKPPCYYCGDVVEYKMGSSGSQTYHLDRLDNRFGYHKDNVVVCCKKCNFAKGDRYTYEEWFAMTKALRDHRKSLKEFQRRVSPMSEGVADMLYHARK
jgi:hypothetical protein